MNGCKAMQARFSDYLDGRLNGRQMQEIGAHLERCRACAREWESLRQTHMSLAEVGPVPEPKDLLLRIRVAVSQERARSRRSILSAWNLAWKNTVGPFLLQASAGFASAVLLLGTVIVLVTMFTQPEAGAGQHGRAAGQSDCAAAGELFGWSGQQRHWRGFRAGDCGGLRERRRACVRLSDSLRAERRADTVAGGEPAAAERV